MALVGDTAKSHGSLSRTGISAEPVVFVLYHTVVLDEVLPEGIIVPLRLSYLRRHAGSHRLTRFAEADEAEEVCVCAPDQSSIKGAVDTTPTVASSQGPTSAWPPATVCTRRCPVGIRPRDGRWCGEHGIAAFTGTVSNQQC